MLVVGEPAAGVEDVWVTRGEDVVAITGVDAEGVTDGVRMTCRVRAAAVCISLGGATCSKGQLQARMEKIRLTTASIVFEFWIIKIYSFLLTAWGNISLLFYHFRAPDLNGIVLLEMETPRLHMAAGLLLLTDWGQPAKRLIAYLGSCS
jgi:hypothetical protein